MKFLFPLAKRGLIFLPTIFLSKLVSADCDITDIGGCIADALLDPIWEFIQKIPGLFFSFLLGILNSPVLFLLDKIKNLLIEPVNIDLFATQWSLIIYILSLFYGLLLLFIGLRLVVSGESPEGREGAKSSLRNTIIMIFLVQLSFYIYRLILDTISAITEVIFNQIDNAFFLITAEGISGIGLGLVFVIPYLCVLMVFLIILSLRYILVASGVVLFAIGLFFYFIKPLHSFGSLILNTIIVTITLPLWYSIVFWISSKVLNVAVFSDYKILVSLGSFWAVVILTFLLALFIIIKAALKIITPVTKIISSIKPFI
jgi:hypothetical protein